MATLKGETSLILTSDDLLRILTEELCGTYGIFSPLAVTMINENPDGDFDLTLTPKPEEESA